MFGSILVNLNSVPSLASSNLSYPGCWAYPVRGGGGGRGSLCAFRGGEERRSLCCATPFHPPHRYRCCCYRCCRCLRARLPLQDMLEVGVMNTQGKVAAPLNHTEARSHFGAWCIVSAPLVR